MLIESPSTISVSTSAIVVLGATVVDTIEVGATVIDVVEDAAVVEDAGTVDVVEDDVVEDDVGGGAADTSTSVVSCGEYGRPGIPMSVVRIWVSDPTVASAATPTVAVNL